MLTLFHHSLPPWAGEYGGWKLEKTVDYFMDFTRLVFSFSSCLYAIITLPDSDDKFQVRLTVFPCQPISGCKRSACIISDEYLFS